MGGALEVLARSGVDKFALLALQAVVMKGVEEMREFRGAVEGGRYKEGDRVREGCSVGGGMNQGSTTPSATW